MFKADGKRYLGPSDGKIGYDFTLWTLAPNQQYLLERADVGPDPSFRMFISAETPVSALFRTYEHFDKDQGAAWFGDYIEYVCDWLPDIKWALIPLEGELGWCIFVPDARAILEKVSAEFRRRAIATAHLLQTQNRVLWVDD